MKKYIVVLSVLALFGCAKTSATDNATNAATSQINNIHNTVNNIQNGLSKECKTVNVMNQLKTINNQIDTLKKQVQTIPAVCSAEKDTLKADNKKLIAYLVVSLAACAFLAFRRAS